MDFLKKSDEKQVFFLEWPYLTIYLEFCYFPTRESVNHFFFWPVMTNRPALTWSTSILFCCILQPRIRLCKMCFSLRFNNNISLMFPINRFFIRHVIGLQMKLITINLPRAVIFSQCFIRTHSTHQLKRESELAVTSKLLFRSCNRVYLTEKD